MDRAVIAGVGLYAPERVVLNEEFSRRYSRDMETFLREQRNIRERRFMAPDQATSDLALAAARSALQDAKVDASEIDLIIVATDTPDYISPSTASVVQYKLGAARAATFDLNSACAGFIAALDVGGKYIAADARYENVLVIGAYGMSKYFDWSDFKSTSVFADGAGAVVLKRSGDANYGVLASELATDGQYHDAMGIYAGGTRTPIDDESLRERKHLLQFTRRIPPEMNRVLWPRIARSLLARVGVSVGDVKLFLFTQINVQSLREAMTELGAPTDRAHLIMDRYGYTGSACLPMALADAVSAGKLADGDLVLMVGTGGGVSMGGVLTRWSRC